MSEPLIFVGARVWRRCVEAGCRSVNALSGVNRAVRTPWGIAMLEPFLPADGWSGPWPYSTLNPDDRTL